MAHGKIRVLLVDDHAFMRLAYKTLLEKQHRAEVVAEASCGSEAYFAYLRHKPDLVIMDITLNDMSGIETTRKIVQRDEHAKVLISSMHQDVVFADRAMKVGAKGYITKGCDPNLLASAVEKVAGGGIFLDPEIAQRLAESKIRGDDDPFSQLSSREFEVLQLLLAGQTVASIAEVLGISAKTVSNLSTSLRCKLKVSTTMELFRLAMQYHLIDA